MKYDLNIRLSDLLHASHDKSGSLDELSTLLVKPVDNEKVSIYRELIASHFAQIERTPIEVQDYPEFAHALCQQLEIDLTVRSDPLFYDSLSTLISLAWSSEEIKQEFILRIDDLTSESDDHRKLFIRSLTNALCPLEGSKAAASDLDENGLIWALSTLIPVDSLFIDEETMLESKPAAVLCVISALHLAPQLEAVLTIQLLSSDVSNDSDNFYIKLMRLSIICSLFPEGTHAARSLHHQFMSADLEGYLLEYGEDPLSVGAYLSIFDNTCSWGTESEPETLELIKSILFDTTASDLLKRSALLCITQYGQHTETSLPYVLNSINEIFYDDSFSQFDIVDSYCTLAGSSQINADILYELEVYTNLFTYAQYCNDELGSYIIDKLSTFGACSKQNRHELIRGLFLSLEDFEHSELKNSEQKIFSLISHIAKRDPHTLFDVICDGLFPADPVNTNCIEAFDRFLGHLDQHTHNIPRHRLDEIDDLIDLRIQRASQETIDALTGLFLRIYLIRKPYPLTPVTRNSPAFA